VGTIALNQALRAALLSKAGLTMKKQIHANSSTLSRLCGIAAHVPVPHQPLALGLVEVMQ